MTNQPIAVYGSSKVQPHEEDYLAACAVGSVLAENGYTVMTGGYSGIMEAASKGAAEAGGQAIGVTAGSIERYRNGTVNAWVTKEIRQETLRERILYLILEPAAYVVMPGGTGTLNELITAWELVRVGDIPKRPIICYGEYWKNMLATMQKSPYLAADAWELLDFAEAPQEIVDILQIKMKVKS